MESTIHEYYVSLEVAKLLKEAGFKWETRASYWFDSIIAKDYILTHPATHDNWNAVKEDGIDYLSAPTLDIAQRWLRELKNIQVGVSPLAGSKKWTYLIAKNFWLLHEDISGIALTPKNFYTYEEALEAGIKKALELILEKVE